MKWTPEQVKELEDLCFAGASNAKMAEHFGIPVTEIHAKRSQLGITIPKIKAMKISQVTTTEISLLSERNGLETFVNEKETCIVLARSGDTALIVMPYKTICRFVVPLEHKPGASYWWQGHYFESLEDAFTYYQELTRG